METLPSPSSAAYGIGHEDSAVAGSLVEQVDHLQQQALEQLERDRDNELLIDQLRAELEHKDEKLRLLQAALHTAETELAFEAKARRKAEAHLASEMAQRRSLITQVVDVVSRKEG